MSIAVTRELLETMGASLDEQMKAIARHFITWADSPENNRAPGETCIRGCANLASGMHWRDAGVTRSKEYGSIIRMTPINILYHNNHNTLLKIAHTSNIMTHNHDTTIKTSATNALIITITTNNTKPKKIYKTIINKYTPQSTKFSTYIQKIPNLLNTPPKLTLSSTELKESWVRDKTLASTLYYF